MWTCALLPMLGLPINAQRSGPVFIITPRKNCVRLLLSSKWATMYYVFAISGIFRYVQPHMRCFFFWKKPLRGVLTRGPLTEMERERESKYKNKILESAKKHNNVNWREEGRKKQQNWMRICCEGHNHHPFAGGMGKSSMIRRLHCNFVLYCVVRCIFMGDDWDRRQRSAPRKQPLLAPPFTMAGIMWSNRSIIQLWQR